MPMRRTIGISVACLVTSACAIDETLQESTSISRMRPPTSARKTQKWRSINLAVSSPRPMPAAACWTAVAASFVQFGVVNV
jgi:hypothetical protein